MDKEVFECEDICIITKLATNNKISGGKTLSNRIPKGNNRLKITLRNAANAVDSELGKFFKKIAFKKGDKQP